MLIHRTETAHPSTSSAARVGRLVRTVAELAVPRDIHAQPAANRRTRERIADDLTSLGYDVRIRGELQNVIAIPPHQRGPFDVVAAHYDSVPFSAGADDNASAVAGLLEVARQRRSHVAFVAFNGEERALSGSREFVRLHRDRPEIEVAAVHVLEMIGYASDLPGSQRIPPLGPLRAFLPPIDAGDFIAVVANGSSARLLDSVRRGAAVCAGAPPLITLRALMGTALLSPDLLRSDHAPFWRANIPAVMWTDTADFRNPHYHRPTDTPETLDYEFLGAVCRLLEATLDVPSRGRKKATHRR